jgi:GNAT superfamily N-acetyltransferase
VGFALYYTSYSTWKGRCLYLEDFYVLSEYRKLGIGSKLFDFVVEVAKNRNVKRMEWQVLDWNENAINFYKKKNANLDDEWLNGRIFF